MTDRDRDILEELARANPVKEGDLSEARRDQLTEDQPECGTCYDGDDIKEDAVHRISGSPIC